MAHGLAVYVLLNKPKRVLATARGDNYSPYAVKHQVHMSFPNSKIFFYAGVYQNDAKICTIFGAQPNDVQGLLVLEVHHWQERRVFGMTVLFWVWNVLIGS